MIFSSALHAQDSFLQPFLKDIDPTVGLSIYYKNLHTGEVLGINDTLVQPAASIIKLPILIYLYRELEWKHLKKNQKYTLAQEDKVGGAGDLQYHNPGKILSLEDLAHEMIRTSDNTATNVLIDQLGMKEINAFLQENVFKATKLRRKMMDFNAVLQGLENTTSALETASILEGVYKGKWTKKRNGKKILKHLFSCEDVSAFKAHIPLIPVAHKTGTLEYVRADAGIFYTEIPFILVCFVRNFESEMQANQILSDLAQFVILNQGK